jgi:threonine dehydrogenase-like Zn-dependent dehydrogenase
MSTTGKAAVLVEPNKLETWEVPIADPEPGGVLVRVVVGGVCGSDLHIYDGGVGVIPMPIILGHEGIGRVEKLGDGVATDYAGAPVAEGDLVYWAPTPLCGRCYACTVLDQPPCENAQFFEHAEKPNWGSLADYAWIPDKMAFFRLPAGAEPDALAALGCALPTAIGGIETGGGVRLGDTVVVQGAGPVGLSAVLVASLGGAANVVVVDSVTSRLEIAKTLGATHCIEIGNSSAEQRKEQVHEISGGTGPRLIVEAAGAIPAFPEGFDLVGSYGVYVILGLWGATGTTEIEPREFTTRNVTVVGDTFHRNRHYYEAMHLAHRVQDRLPLADLITDRFPVDGTLDALKAIEAGKTIKAVIDPTL